MDGVENAMCLFSANAQIKRIGETKLKTFGTGHRVFKDWERVRRKSMARRQGRILAEGRCSGGGGGR